jgi:hypothetical protein
MITEAATRTTLDENAIALTRRYESCQSARDATEAAGFAHQLLDIICEQVKPGVTESEIKTFADACFNQHGVERIWHQPYIRFGKHTLLTYRDKAFDDYRLGDNDIAFIDIGIVKNGIEGDAGKTIVTGEDPEHVRLANASKAIFVQARHYWQKHQPTGAELYNHIYSLAGAMDVVFNLDPAGHLIGEFPHRGWKNGLNNYPEKVIPGTWILEIQICDTARQHGAFYEDLLY